MCGEQLRHLAVAAEGRDPGERERHPGEKGEHAGAAADDPPQRAARPRGDNGAGQPEAEEAAEQRRDQPRSSGSRSKSRTVFRLAEGLAEVRPGERARCWWSARRRRPRRAGRRGTGARRGRTGAIPDPGAAGSRGASAPRDPQELTDLRLRRRPLRRDDGLGGRHLCLRRVLRGLGDGRQRLEKVLLTVPFVIIAGSSTGRESPFSQRFWPAAE